MFAGLSVSWRDLSLPEWSSALRCWWCPTTVVCCSAGDTGTAAFASLSWGKGSWWAGSAGTSVSFLIARRERFLSFLHWHEVIFNFFSLLVYLLRCCYLLGSGSVWHLPHLWFKRHVLHSVAGFAAGEYLCAPPHRPTLSCSGWKRSRQMCIHGYFKSSRRADSPAACRLGLCRSSADTTRR